MHSPHFNTGPDKVPDPEILASALRKVVNRQDLTREEHRALRRHERQKEERLRWKFYRDIPQKHLRKMCGKQTKQINEQAVRYGLPFGGPTVDLTVFFPALFEFLAANASKLSREDEALLQGPASPALEAYREERAKIAKLDRQERERQLVRRDEVRQALARIAVILRGAGDTLQRQFGAEAVEILYEALEDAEREIEHAFGDDQEGNSVDRRERTDPEAESNGPG